MPNMNDLVRDVKVRFVDIGDVASTGRAVIEITPEGGLVELPRGERGPRGYQGAAADPVKFGGWKAHPDDLPVNLGLEEANTIYPVASDKSLRVWTGVSWMTYPNWMGTEGPAGPSQQVRVGTVQSGPEPEVVLSPESNELTAVLDFVLQRGPQGVQGEKGDQGPTATISTAADFDTAKAAQEGDSLVWNGDLWEPRRNAAPVGPYTLPSSQFNSASVGLLQFGNTPRVILGELPIPAQPFAWRPMVTGQVWVNTSFSVTVDIEATIGSASGTLVGLGSDVANRNEFNRIQPFFNEAVTPASTHARVEAGTPTTIVVSARRTGGAIGDWSTTTVRAQMQVMCQPCAS